MIVLSGNAIVAIVAVIFIVRFIWNLCCCGPVKNFLTTVIHLLVIAVLFSAFNGIMSHVNVTKIAENINSISTFINNATQTLDSMNIQLNVTHYKELMNNVLK